MIHSKGCNRRAAAGARRARPPLQDSTAGGNRTTIGTRSIMSVVLIIGTENRPHNEPWRGLVPLPTFRAV
jgi:hypothetical protein